jgi:hypothetical protein
MTRQDRKPRRFQVTSEPLGETRKERKKARTEEDARGRRRIEKEDKEGKKARKLPSGNVVV